MVNARPVILEMRGICKMFPGVAALSNVDLELRAGEVHALIGENGAGKSTLMKILTGVYSCDRGEILVDGRQVSISGTDKARALGIEMIYQESALVPHLNVAENLFLGRELASRVLPTVLDRRSMKIRAAEILGEFGLPLDIDLPARSLSLAQQRLVQIAKALAFGCRVIILDETTASLSPSEVQDLFRRIREVVSRGVAVLFVSHRLNEVEQIADRVTVLRDGSKIVTANTSDVKILDLVRMMVGRDIELSVKRQASRQFGRETLRVEHLVRPGLLHDISFSAREGEIVGIAGLVGAGRTELMRALFGADRVSSGRVLICGEEVAIKCPSDAVSRGIGFLTEDRRRDGLALSRTVVENITLASLGKLTSRLGGCIKLKAEIATAEHYVKTLRIKTPSLFQKVKFLSGGNQQKIVLAKWLASQAEILIFDEPTRGIDVAAKAEVHQLMLDLAAKGKTILMVSSELPELLTVSDRILVMREGCIVGELSADEATEERVMALASMGTAQTVVGA